MKFMPILKRWPTLNNDSAIIDFPANGHNSAWFKFKTNIAARTGNYATKDIKIRVPLKIAPLKSPLENHWKVFN